MTWCPDSLTECWGVTGTSCDLHRSGARPRACGGNRHPGSRSGHRPRGRSTDYERAIPRPDPGEARLFARSVQPSGAQRSIFDGGQFCCRGCVSHRMLDRIGVHRRRGDDGTSSGRTTLAPTAPTRGITAGCELRRVPDRFGLGRNRQAAKIITGHHLPKPGGLLAAGCWPTLGQAAIGVVARLGPAMNPGRPVAPCWCA
jgi:hypothetical protein